MNEVVLSWPAAIALIGVCMTITAGVLKMFGMGRNTITTSSLQQDISKLGHRLGNVEQKVTALETTVDRTITNQMQDLKQDVRELSSKMDTLVKEVITALGALNRS